MQNQGVDSLTTMAEGRIICRVVVRFSRQSIKIRQAAMLESKVLLSNDVSVGMQISP